MPAKQAIKDKLQDSVATYLRCRGVVNKQIKKGLLLSLWLKKNLKSVNIWIDRIMVMSLWLRFLAHPVELNTPVTALNPEYC